MRKTIRTPQLRSDYYSKRIERLATNDVQNMEIGKLVDTIVNSQDGQQRLAEVFSEADHANKGMGNVLKEIWENDNFKWNQFKIDQETNGKMKFVRTLSVHSFLSLIATGRSSNKRSSITICLGELLMNLI